jgi:hypothetical protein
MKLFEFALLVGCKRSGRRLACVLMTSEGKVLENQLHLTGVFIQHLLE